MQEFSKAKSCKKILHYTTEHYKIAKVVNNWITLHKVGLFNRFSSHDYVGWQLISYS